MSERPGVRTPIDEKILPRNVARLSTAKVGAVVAELLGGAEAPGRNALLAGALRFLGGFAPFPFVVLDVGPQAVGPHCTREQVVDCHVLAHRAPPEPGHEPRDAPSRTIRQAQTRPSPLF